MDNNNECCTIKIKAPRKLLSTLQKISSVCPEQSFFCSNNGCSSYVGKAKLEKLNNVIYYELAYLNHQNH